LLDKLLGTTFDCLFHERRRNAPSVLMKRISATLPVRSRNMRYCMPSAWQERLNGVFGIQARTDLRVFAPTVRYLGVILPESPPQAAGCCHSAPNYITSISANQGGVDVFDHCLDMTRVGSALRLVYCN